MEVLIIDFKTKYKIFFIKYLGLIKDTTFNELDFYFGSTKTTITFCFIAYWNLNEIICLNKWTFNCMWKWKFSII